MPGKSRRLAAATDRLKAEIALNRDFTGLSEVAFLSLVWTWKRLERAGRQFFEGHGLTDAQFNALMILWDYRGRPLRQHELADLLVVNRASAGSVLDRMEPNGWIERVPDPADRRAMMVTITKGGIAKLNEVRAPYYRLMDGIFAPHDEAVLSELVVTCDALRGHLTTPADAQEARVAPGKARRRQTGSIPGARTARR